MSQLALGVTVFKRLDKVGDLLRSIQNDRIDRVIIADNGKITDEKRAIYDSYDETDLTVLDVEYDSGLGNSRKQIVDELKEEYLLVVDSDVIIPGNVVELQAQLEARPDLGGVGGVLWEDERIRSDCYDLHDQGDVLLRSIEEKKRIPRVANAPLVEFDVIQNVTVFRRECLEDYCWDPEYTIGWEHTDFFLGHKKDTRWRFGLNPNVLFKHNPGGNAQYLNHRKSKARLRRSKQYFLNKWGYKQVVNGQVNWLQSNDGLPTKRRLLEEFGKHVILSLPQGIQAFLMNLRDKIRDVQGKPPF